MALTKTEHFTREQQQAAAFFKALGHPARLAILDLLSRRKACICGDITEELPLAQSTVSQHLKALKEAGLIKGEIDGVRTCYCLSEEGVALLNELAPPIIEQLNTINKTACC